MRSQSSRSAPNGAPLLALLGCALALPAAAQDSRLSGATAAVEATIGKSGAEVAVAFISLDGHSSWFLRADEPFHAASTMKVPVLIELYSQAHQGKLHLDDPLVIRN